MLAPGRLLPIPAATATLAARVCGDYGGLPSTTPTPPAHTDADLTATTTGAPAVTHTPALTSTPAPAGPRFLYRGVGRTVDTARATERSNPLETRLGSVGHAAEWGSFPSLSPAAGATAYVLLPEGLLAPSYEAEAGVADLADDKWTGVAGAVYPRARPQWSPDGELVCLLSNEPDSIAVIQVNRATGENGTAIPLNDQLAPDFASFGWVRG